MKFGYFDDRNREYVITTPKTPLPWINYLGSKDFFSPISTQAEAIPSIRMRSSFASRATDTTPSRSTTTASTSILRTGTRSGIRPGSPRKPRLTATSAVTVWAIRNSPPQRTASLPMSLSLFLWTTPVKSSGSASPIKVTKRKN